MRIFTTNRAIAAITAILFLAGCAGMIRNLNEDWASKNRQVTAKLGQKSYDKITKEQAMNAMVVALQRLDLTLSNANKTIGLLVANGPAPSPLTKAEMETVIAAENGNAQSIAPGMIWNFNDFESDFSVSFLEYGDGVQINVKAKLKFVGDRSAMIPVNQFPPKALEIGLAKIFDEFEKIVFIQGRTLRKD